LYKQPYKALSLFTGAGGMDVGFTKAGIEVALANEINKHACETFRHNNPDVPLLEGDVSLLQDELASAQGIDFIFGGPPCQGFSVAGKMDPKDERSKLVFTFASIVNSIKPIAFVMENVKALYTLQKFSDVRKELFRSFDLSGYNCDAVLLNSAEFGVPQSRERTFFIGISKDLPRFESNHLRSYVLEEVSLHDAISHLGPAGSQGNPRTCNAQVTIAAKPVMRKSPYAGMLFNGQGRPLNPSRPASTLPASMGGNRTPIIDELQLHQNAPPWVEEYHTHLVNGGEPYGMHDAPERLRRLTLAEAAIIQSFPNEYEFQGPNSAIYSQIGNAVPCRLAEAVARSVIDSINEKPVSTVANEPLKLEI